MTFYLLANPTLLANQLPIMVPHIHIPVIGIIIDGVIGREAIFSYLLYKVQRFRFQQNSRQLMNVHCKLGVYAVHQFDTFHLCQ